ncbi:TetR/AcrR family transcriptional regulator [Frankia gtarii]|uniref:TetR/AcrR family transcriptional regulator n=1 Tax=Frankia gtarii TaxID=2950102 RepID=UPI0021C065C2|nr:TetR/AcrR family transcriptional regulator [Frankia gtarii]
MTAATEAFASIGYAKTSIAEVAVTAGASVGLIYYHFKNKEGLFFAIWNEYQHDQERKIRTALRAAQDDGVTERSQLLVLSVRTYLAGAWEARLVVRMAHVNDTPPGFNDERSLANQRWMRRNRRLLESADPYLTEAVLVAMLASIGALCGAVAACADQEAAAELIERAVRVVHGLVGVLESVDEPGRLDL